ncbi:GntR family transcriptional regulator [Paenibacillus sp. Y412MC10]|uniref:GntR family transcriptional regulator n=1 Tax=Geobacillus sp. (strain Y412MC10) TaxID=481743 RepID=UPI00119E0E5E|nr:GntR family transcriptional regulator [Paenibacillus sp. Y412MC10]
MAHKLMLRVDPHAPMNVSTQVKEQLKWLIGIGQIEPFDMLPPAGALADNLGLNRNTVNLVYNQLKDEGIVSMHKGKGTQVLNNPQVEELRNRRKLMHELAERTTEELGSLHIPASEFFSASLAYTLLQEPVLNAERRILFIECKGHDFPFYQKAIAEITGAEVKTVFLEDLLAGEQALLEAFDYSSLIVTTLNHDSEVKALCSKYDKKAFVIGANAETSVLLDIARLTPGSYLSFVCLGKAGAQWMAGRVQEAGIDGVRASLAGLDHREDLLQRIEQSDQVYASDAVYEEVRSLAPGKVKLFPMALEKSSVNMLRDMI